MSLANLRPVCHAFGRLKASICDVRTMFRARSYRKHSTVVLYLSLFTCLRIYNDVQVFTAVLALGYTLFAATLFIQVWVLLLALRWEKVTTKFRHIITDSEALCLYVNRQLSVLKRSYRVDQKNTLQSRMFTSWSYIYRFSRFFHCTVWL